MHYHQAWSLPFSPFPYILHVQVLLILQGLPSSCHPLKETFLIPHYPNWIFSHSPLQISISFPECISCPAMYANNICPSQSLTKACASFPFVVLCIWMKEHTLEVGIRSMCGYKRQAWYWIVAVRSRCFPIWGPTWAVAEISSSQA